MNYKRNLLQETNEVLAANGRTLDDVVWIGTKDFKIPFEDWESLADEGYNPGFGSAEVCRDLILVGKHFWLERHEYDGSEWWEYKQIPYTPTETRKVSSLFVQGYEYDLLSNVVEEKND